MPSAIVIRTAGTNCDAELVRAFSLAGAATDLVHLDRLIADPSRLDRYDIIAFPGGFSYGDDVASGRIFAMRTRERLYPALRGAADRGCPIIGVCNGFQVLVQVGLLPGSNGCHGQRAEAIGHRPQATVSDPGCTTHHPTPDTRPNHGRLPSVAGRGTPDGGTGLLAPPQTASLAPNTSGRFIDRWVRVSVDPDSPCLWTAGLAKTFADDPDRADALLRLPVAHGEGRFITDSLDTLRRLEANHQIALRYAGGDDPNGSQAAIAGICDPTGRIFGLMPHPERYLEWTHHPFWTRLPASQRRGPTPGLTIFHNAVEAAATIHS